VRVRKGVWGIKNKNDRNCWSNDSFIPLRTQVFRNFSDAELKVGLLRQRHYLKYSSLCYESVAIVTQSCTNVLQKWSHSLSVSLPVGTFLFSLSLKERQTLKDQWKRHEPDSDSLEGESLLLASSSVGQMVILYCYSGRGGRSWQRKEYIGSNSLSQSLTPLLYPDCVSNMHGLTYSLLPKCVPNVDRGNRSKSYPDCETDSVDRSIPGSFFLLSLSRFRDAHHERNREKKLPRIISTQKGIRGSRKSSRFSRKSEHFSRISFVQSCPCSVNIESCSRLPVFPLFLCPLMQDLLL
jgi:hypothetical protein